MALAGVAGAETSSSLGIDDFNDYIDNSLTSAGYKEGDAFALTFKVTSDGYAYATSGGIIKFDENYYMVSQNAGGSAYLGLSYKSDSDVYSSANTVANPNFVTDPNIFKTDSSKKITEWTTGQEEYLYSWITTDPGTTGHQPKYITNATFTIETDGTDSNICVTLGDGKTFDVTLTGIVLNANELDIMGAITKVENYSMSIPSVPEPATATLSLLALAGLAARRRRK